MSVRSILLDTTVLTDIRRYHAAQTQANARQLDLLRKAQYCHETLLNSPANGLVFFASEMSTVEMKVNYIKYHLFEYLRSVHHLPADSLYDRRSDVLKTLRPEFNKDQLNQVIENFRTESAEIMQKIRILPYALPPADIPIWRERQQILFMLIPEYESFDTQDAYILASAIAADVDEMWCSDTAFHKAANRLRNLSSKQFTDILKVQYPILFPTLTIPQVKSPPSQPGKPTAA